ncbi:unnamed protein product, partial [marine sediment metagenome]
MYSTKEQKDVELRVFIRDTAGNTNSALLVIVDKNSYYKY